MTTAMVRRFTSEILLSGQSRMAIDWLREQGRYFAWAAVAVSAVATSALAQEEPEAPELSNLAALETVPVPLPPNLDDFVVDRTAAIQLGKALFWDLQVGGDGATACASCHFHAGVDNRTQSTLAPRLAQFRGANHTLKKDDFPFHKLANPHERASASNPVVSDTSEVAGSQGVVKTNFNGINNLSRIDRGATVPDATFTNAGANMRQVTGRNAPSVINAIYTDRNFWDGRANRFFNGVNPFGDMDPDAKVWVTGPSGLTQIRILLDNGSLASQAVGPVNNEVEMSWNGRTFPELGRKMLSRRPLDMQRISTTDSVLGVLASDSTGFDDSRMTYAQMVRRAFPPRFWNSRRSTPDGFTLMESNFSLFWGLSIMMYESTLVSDDSPFDRFMKGDQNALSAEAQQGMAIFEGVGKCANCHSGPEFTGAAVSQLRGVLAQPNEGMVELMAMGNGLPAFYDGGFYNIGVRPTEEDLGVGGSHPAFGPLSYAARAQNGKRFEENGAPLVIGPNDRIAVKGAFKTPSLRNIELTGPYMHNGGMKSLEEVVEFYTRGADFHDQNHADLDPDVGGISEIANDPQQMAALVAFLKSLTDERVRNQAAPFDHPSLPIFQGSRGVIEGEQIENVIVLPAVGASGGTPIRTFEEDLK